MGHYIIKRLLISVMVVWGVSTVVFFLLRLSGNPAALLIDPSASQEAYDALLSFYGLDQPIHIQYVRFMSQLVRGELGVSFLHRVPALQITLERVPATIQLAFATLIVAIIISIPLGITAAIRRDSWLDNIASMAAVIGQALPNFWLGIMLILIFAVFLRLLPTSGRGDWRYLILPTLTLAMRPAAKYFRLTRSEIINVLGQDYVRTARGKGLPENMVLYRHALRNAAVALIAMIGLDLTYLLGGAVVTETVFAWPGLGKLIVDSVSFRDYPVVQASVLLIAILVVIINLATDIIVSLVDPRIRLAEK